MATTIPTTTDTVLSATLMRRGHWAKADIKRASTDHGNAILKDFAHKHWMVQSIGRLQHRRETGALARLKGIPGIPSCFGSVVPCGLLLEEIKGERITRWRRRSSEEIERMFESLTRLVDAMHARGVAHLDLRKRDNILIRQDGTPGIIDFNASVYLEPGRLPARLLLPILRWVDQQALLKWKLLLRPSLLTPEQRRQHRFANFLRRLWIFN